VYVRLLVLDQDDPHDFPDRLILSARERGLTALARSAVNELNAARGSLQRLEELRQGLSRCCRKGVVMPVTAVVRRPTEGRHQRGPPGRPGRCPRWAAHRPADHRPRTNDQCGACYFDHLLDE